MTASFFASFSSGRRDGHDEEGFSRSSEVSLVAFSRRSFGFSLVELLFVLGMMTILGGGLTLTLAHRLLGNESPETVREDGRKFAVWLQGRMTEANRRREGFQLFFPAGLTESVLLSWNVTGSTERFTAGGGTWFSVQGALTTRSTFTPMQFTFSPAFTLELRSEKRPRAVPVCYFVASLYGRTDLRDTPP
jgi:type II secretory pathway pseudopilin PulG